MGSDLYSVKVLEKHDRTVTLRVEVINLDQDELSENLSFALMVLREGTDGQPGAPLAKEVSFYDTLDEDWLQLYTRGFIDSSRSVIESGSGRSELERDRIRGSLTVTVTDPAWIEHLQPGAEFASRAFEAAWDFEDCEPIRPGQTAPATPVPEAFIAVPGALWTAGGLLEQPWPELQLRVTPYHAMYLRHLDEPFDPLPLESFVAAQPWEGPPATPATAPPSP